VLKAGALVSTDLAIAVALVCLAVGVLAGYWLPPHGRRPPRRRIQSGRRILLPFTGRAISRRAFEAAVRLAEADNATIVPAFLARVPRQLPIDPGAAVDSSDGIPLLSELQQRGTALGVAVDGRVARGRTYRDALSHLLDGESFDRIIVSASDTPRSGLSGDDLKWLLTRAPAEVMVLRPAPDDTRRISATMPMERTSA
jgi:hypothetical protein